MCTQRSAFLSGLLGAVLLLPGATAFAQQPAAPPGIGVVTAIQGQATVARQALPQPASLRFKDDVFFRDQITTQERSTIRLLLGGKGVLTVREQSQVTLDETVAPDGSRRSVLSLLAGKIGAAIARSLMRTGDEVEIRTPNAVAAVRGTAFVVEYVPPQKSAGTTKPVLLASSAPGPYLAQAPGASDGKSNFFVFSGSVTITPQGQPPVTLGPMQAMSVTATPGGVQSGTVQNITPADAARAAQGLEAGKPHIGEAGGSRIALAQLQIAAAVAGNIVQSVGRQPPSLSVIRELTTRPPGTYTNVTGVGPVIASENATSSGTGGTTPPPPPPPPPPGTANALPSGTILSLNNSGVSMSGASIAEFSGGAANTIVPVDISGTPGTVYDPTNPNRVTSPLLPAIGSPVSHSGPMGSLNNFTLFGFDVTTGTDITTPLARITGTSLTNTDGPLFSMTGNSELFTDGPLLSLENGGSATLAGVLAMSGDPSSETSALAFVGSADGVSIPSGTSLIATAPLFTLTGNSVLADFSTAPTSGGTQAGNGPGGAGLFSVGGTLTLTGNGALLSATDSSAVVVGSLLSSSGGTINMNGTGAAVQLDNATLALPNGGSLISLNNGASLTASGPALDAVNGGGVVLGGDGGGGPIFALRGGSRVNWTGGPLIHLDSSTLIADGGFGDSDGTGNVVNISGTAGAAAVLLDATDTNITFGGSRIPNAGTTDTDVTTFSAPAGVPLIRLTRSTYSDTSPDSELVPHSDGTTTFDGLFVVASSSDITLAGKVLDLCCGERITTTATTPLLQFDQSNLTVSGSFLRVADGGQLTSTSTDPLVPLIRLTGGIHDIGTVVGPNTGALMDLRGVNQDASGLGTDQVL
ncbi:MAG TPA: FecR family protein, partial [Candidatus Methylomirabilis sp.]|nr:FecR family protein [Candidatus Methylomirabilis sp.]